jgi:hypothetical protein
MRHLLCAAIVLAATTAAQAQMRITEYMYQSTFGTGIDGEFIEFANVGNTPIDMAGWSFDDSSQNPGTVDLSAFGVVQPGEAVILTEVTDADFRFNWGLSAGIDVIGLLTANLGRADEINLYDATNTLVDRLTYDDETFAGTHRARDISAWGFNGLGTNDITQWQASALGDMQSPWFSSVGELASPGLFVPEPGTLALLTVGAVGLIRRRRRAD